jgi:outer membrane murein-binding lipoprotein Lpp
MRTRWWPRRKLSPELYELYYTVLVGIERELQHLNRKVDDIMATLEDLQGAVDRLEADADKVAVAVKEAKDSIAALTQQVADLIAAGAGITEDQAQGILGGLDDVDAKLDAAVPDAASSE